MTNWSKVKIVAKEGTQFGILYDENGELAIVCKQKNESWPHGLKPKAGLNEIGSDCKAYMVMSDEEFEKWQKKNLSK